MRIIIIIQALVILIGAYYIFAQSQENVDSPEMLTVPAMVVPTDRAGYTPPTEDPPVDETKSENNATSGITGHSDVGMEYPIMDETLEVR